MTRAEDLRTMRERWTDVPSAVRQSIAADLAAGRTITHRPYGVLGDRIDLRGFPLNKAYRRRTPEAAILLCGTEIRPADRPGARWEDLDLTGADLGELRWFHLTVQNCVLDDADLQHLRCWEVQVLQTSARRANLFHSQLGSPGIWQNVDLRQADLRGMIAHGRFEQVDFRNAKLRGANFAWSDLAECVFAGVLPNITIGALPFEERPANWQLTGVNMTAARPRELSLIGVDLGAESVDIQLPMDSEHWLIPGWSAFLDRLQLVITDLPEGGDLRLDAQIWLNHERRHCNPGQRTGFIAAWDLESFGGSELRHWLQTAVTEHLTDFRQ